MEHLEHLALVFLCGTLLGCIYVIFVDCFKESFINGLFDRSSLFRPKVKDTLTRSKQDGKTLSTMDYAFLPLVDLSRNQKGGKHLFFRKPEHSSQDVPPGGSSQGWEGIIMDASHGAGAVQRIRASERLSLVGPFSESEDLPNCCSLEAVRGHLALYPKA